MELTIECQKRSPESKPNALRQSGLIPAVIYGHKGTESISVAIPAKAAETLVKKASVNNTLVDVKVADGWSGKALLREVQTHPWRNSIYHLSFFSIAQQDSIEATVPLHFVGESIGVKQNGGALDTVLNELTLKCPPESIPETIDVDITDLDVGGALHVGDLKLPAGVEAVGDSDRVVVTVLVSTTGRDADADAAAAIPEA
ncbi:50S ribosomal protein L25/general stress protein Ctc [Microcoleus sp. FACHB-1515]|uniref:50S ribosomal protein L25/general stress protein Ctc n=1 Tax=Cyanophyceae TaxID=3028117 RepID=UPI001689C67C|nr:50S ribosomal protein L25/general stress protein Ctc [Microcoleus sp. FACHB-1515]MBD2089027.1 50S ribosomal protein L25/general stress protein Ctc [Microcoleus sp. FACHB-1515]